MQDSEAGVGWVLFAGIMILIAGTLNVIWGIAAIGNSKFFTENATYILSGLNTWGWIVLVIGLVQFFAGVLDLVGRLVRPLARDRLRGPQLDSGADVDLRLPVLGPRAVCDRHPGGLRARRVRRAAVARLSRAPPD